MKDNKIKINKINRVLGLSTKILKVFYIVLIVGIILLITYLFKSLDLFSFFLKILMIITPVIVGLIFAWLFNPLINFFQSKKINRIISTIITYLLFILLIAGFFYLFVPSLMNQIKELTSMMPKLIKNTNDFINNLTNGLNKIDSLDLSSVSKDIDIFINNLGSNLVNDLPNNFIKFVSNLLSITGQFLLSLLIGFYLSLNYDKTKINFNKLFSAKQFKELKLLIKIISKKSYDFFKGTFISTIILFIMCLIGFLISGLKAPLLFALFCSVINIIPYVGAFIGGVPTIIVGLSQGTSVGVMVLIIFIVIQVIYGNFLLPYVMKKTMKLNQVTMLIGLLLFSYFFGLFGMVISVPVIAILKLLMKFLFKKLNLFGYTDYDFEQELIN